LTTDLTKRKQFAAAVLATCTLYHVRDPETEKLGWLIRCQDGNKQEYTSPNFVKKLGKAKSVAHEWLSHRPKKYTVSVQELRHAGAK